MQVIGPAAAPRGVVIAHAVAAAPAQPQPAESHRLNHKKLHITQAALGVDEITNDPVGKRQYLVNPKRSCLCPFISKARHSKCKERFGHCRTEPVE